MAVRAAAPLRFSFSLLALLGGGAALVAALPLVGVLLAAFGGPVADIAWTDVARYALTSVWLALLVGVLTAVLGTLAAWLVVMYRFPGRRLFNWALALPLAAPGFALAYAYGDLLDPAGPVRLALRAVGTDLPVGIRSIAGAAFVLSCAFYPYVFLATRAAFLNQSVSALEAARSLGCSERRAFLRVALPLARPALAAGVALAVMETLADYGAVQFLNVQTLTTGVVRAWSVYNSTASAARFALPLLAAAALLLWLERRGRNGSSADGARARWREVPVRPLRGVRAAMASLFCTALLFFSLMLPVGWLLWRARLFTPEWDRLTQAALHSVSLGVIGAVLTVALATALALGVRRFPPAGRIASLGYATPGAVMAIGLLVPAALVWQVSAGASLFWVSIALLLYAYAARLMAAALEPIDAGLQRVSPNLVGAARSLGRSESRAALAVELPIARPAMLTAALLVFVDIVKELPATLILRPFNFDTLAVIANAYALDERLGQAGWPSLLILCLSLPVVVVLSRQIAGARPGA